MTKYIHPLIKDVFNSSYPVVRSCPVLLCLLILSYSHKSLIIVGIVISATNCSLKSMQNKLGIKKKEVKYICIVPSL